MKDKIEVGEYVRIDKSSRFLGIGKVIRIVGNTIYLKMYIDLPISFSEEEIKQYRHSKNIIDLIEVGDYVNGCLVVEISRGRKYFTIVGKYGLTQYEFQKVRDKVYNVKSIVTKEQFSNIEYKV